MVCLAIFVALVTRYQDDDKEAAGYINENEQIYLDTAAPTDHNQVKTNPTPMQ